MLFGVIIDKIIFVCYYFRSINPEFFWFYNLILLGGYRGAFNIGNNGGFRDYFRISIDADGARASVGKTPYVSQDAGYLFRRCD
jgi:hypothetical protein